MPYKFARPDYRFFHHGRTWLCEYTNEQARDHLRKVTPRQADWIGTAIEVPDNAKDALATLLTAQGFRVEVAGQMLEAA